MGLGLNQTWQGSSWDGAGGLTHGEPPLHPDQQLLGVLGPGLSVEQRRLHARVAALQRGVHLPGLRRGQ